MNNNQTNPVVTLDFNTAIQSNEIAIMPASLAKKLLKMMAGNLQYASSRDINSAFIDEVRSNIDSVPNVVEIARSFVLERELVSHILKEDWDFYKVIQGEDVNS
jgi:hypothetical protein